MTGAVAVILLAFGAGIVVERCAAAPAAPPVGLASLAPRLAAFALLFAVWFGLFRRPALSAFAALVTVAVLSAISVHKRRLVAEPLVFSDFALLRTIARHPDLYYLGFASDLRFVAGWVALLGATGAWLWLEPPRLTVAAGLALSAAALGACGLAWRLADRAPLAGWLACRLPRPALEADVGRLGLLLTLVAYALRWRGEIATGAPARPSVRHGPATGAAPDRVVVVQLESFTDPVRAGSGGDPLPGLERLRRLAPFHGPLAVPTHGAYTMRTEHEVLTGLAGAASFRGFDPYLSSRGTVPPSLATALRERGYRTVFLHPFRAGFFNRDAVMPRLGFDELLWEEDFAGAERHGPYLSDPALIGRVLAEARRDGGRPVLVMAVTMENHGPWPPDRFADEPDPVRQYRRHLASADRAISALLDGLAAEARPTLLCVYGDHPPILPGFASAGAPQSEYAVVELGPGARPGGTAERPLASHELGRLLGALALGRPTDEAPPDP